MKTKYHINPKTGVPTICRAKKGNCPLGNSNHFNTYSEAQFAAQELLKEEHSLLPSSNYGMDNDLTIHDIKNLNIEETGDSEYEENINSFEELMLPLTNKYDSLIDGSSDSYLGDNVEFKKEIRTTDDEELLMSIIEGRAYLRDDWEYVSLALQNPNLPKKYIYKLIGNPDDYNYEALRHLMKNPSLTETELLIVANEHPDKITQTLAMMNPNITEEFAKDFVNTRKEELSTLPWMGMLENDKLNDLEVFEDYRIECFKDNISLYDKDMNSILSKYKDWLVLYNNLQE